MGNSVAKIGGLASFTSSPNSADIVLTGDFNADMVRCGTLRSGFVTFVEKDQKGLAEKDRTKFNARTGTGGSFVGGGVY